MFKCICMKNIPSVEKVLKWAKFLGLCGPIADNLERFLVNKGIGDTTNLERIFIDSKESMETFSDRLITEFVFHLLEKHFQVAV